MSRTCTRATAASRYDHVRREPPCTSASAGGPRPSDKPSMSGAGCLIVRAPASRRQNSAIDDRFSFLLENLGSCSLHPALDVRLPTALQVLQDVCVDEEGGKEDKQAEAEATEEVPEVDEEEEEGKAEEKEVEPKDEREEAKEEDNEETWGDDEGRPGSAGAAALANRARIVRRTPVSAGSRVLGQALA